MGAAKNEQGGTKWQRYATGCGPATPLSMSKHHWKNLENFVDHKLLDGKRIMFKYPTLIFAKKRCGPATPLRVAKHR